jgi:hypothetical protein
MAFDVVGNCGMIKEISIQEHLGPASVTSWAMIQHDAGCNLIICTEPSQSQCHKAVVHRRTLEPAFKICVWGCMVRVCFCPLKLQPVRSRAAAQQAIFFAFRGLQQFMPRNLNVSSVTVGLTLLPLFRSTSNYTLLLELFGCLPPGPPRLRPSRDPPPFQSPPP